MPDWSQQDYHHPAVGWEAALVGAEGDQPLVKNIKVRVTPGVSE
ncbi:hypothetical protein [Kribbella sp. NPDC004536]